MIFALAATSLTATSAIQVTSFRSVMRTATVTTTCFSRSQAERFLEMRPDSIESHRADFHGGVSVLKRLAATSLCAMLLAASLAAQALTVRIDGDQLRINSPHLHFLEGEAINRLHDGATVKYALQLSART